MAKPKVSLSKSKNQQKGSQQSYPVSFDLSNLDKSCSDNEYRLDFGDATDSDFVCGSKEISITHSYKTAGTYLVYLFGYDGSTYNSLCIVVASGKKPSTTNHKKCNDFTAETPSCGQNSFTITKITQVV